jgi:hypothetical protein
MADITSRVRDRTLSFAIDQVISRFDRETHHQAILRMLIRPASVQQQQWFYTNEKNILTNVSLLRQLPGYISDVNAPVSVIPNSVDYFRPNFSGSFEESELGKKVKLHTWYAVLSFMAHNIRDDYSEDVLHVKMYELRKACTNVPGAESSLNDLIDDEEPFDGRCLRDWTYYDMKNMIVYEGDRPADCFLRLINYKISGLFDEDDESSSDSSDSDDDVADQDQSTAPSAPYDSDEESATSSASSSSDH